DDVISSAELIHRLSAVEGHQTVNRPTVRQDPRTVRRTRDVPSERGREVVARVEVTVAVFSLQVCTVIRYNTAIRRNLIECMCPSIGKRGRQAMPGSQPQRGLERVVVGGPDTVELVDATVVRVLCNVVSIRGWLVSNGAYN